MAAGLVEVIDIAGDDNDEVLFLYSTPASGKSKINAICVEDYRPRIIDLSKYTSYFDDEVRILDSPSNFVRRVYKGECSNSKSKSDAGCSRIPKITTCEICADEKNRSDMFRILGCAHYYCTSCIGNYVGAKLQENVTKIGCPVPGCNGVLEPYHCRSILPKQVFDRWGDALCEAVILGSEKFYCPFKDCSALLIDDRGGRNEVIVQSTCPYCNRLFCVECKVPWHAEITCKEFKTLKKDERGNEDIMLMNLAKKQQWQRCRKCGFYVEKRDGCMFMKCRCGFCFCYGCGTTMSATTHFCSKCRR